MNDWQRENLTAIHERLAWVKEQEDGRIFQKIRPHHIIIVDKRGNKLRLGLPAPVSEMIQSVLNLDNPLYLTAPYNQAFMLALLWKPQPRRLFMAGVGGGCLPLVLHHHLPDVQIDGAELDEIVLQAAQRFFGLQLDQRLMIIVDEARQNLAQRAAKYDLIFVDVFMGNGLTPYQFVTQEFYEICTERLQPDGVIVANMAHDWPFYADKIKTLQSVFKHVYIFRVEMGNSAVLATNGEFIDADALVERTKALQNQHRFAFSLIKRAQSVHLPDNLLDLVPGLPDATILRDDNRPSDYPLEPRKL